MASIYSFLAISERHCACCYYVAQCDWIRSNLGSSKQVGPHSRSRPSSLLNRTINEAAPAQCPVRAGKEDVSLSLPHVLQVVCQQARGRKEPEQKKDD